MVAPPPFHRSPGALRGVELLPEGSGEEVRHGEERRERGGRSHLRLRPRRSQGLCREDETVRVLPPSFPPKQRAGDEVTEGSGSGGSTQISPLVTANYIAGFIIKGSV